MQEGTGGVAPVSQHHVRVCHYHVRACVSIMYVKCDRIVASALVCQHITYIYLYIPTYIIYVKIQQSRARDFTTTRFSW